MKAIVCVSDLHIGSTLGLSPQKAIVVDTGEYSPNKHQRTLLKYWRHFWSSFVPEVAKGADKIFVVVNGDVIDGVHHNAVNIISNSWAVQARAAIDVLNNIKLLCPVNIDQWFAVRGTEAHVGPNGESEEGIAKAIGATPNDLGEHSSYQWWLNVEDGGKAVMFQFAHHISGTSSAAYESSAPMREMVAALVEASQWGQRMPDVLVRSHRHRFIPVSIPSLRGRIQSVITPGWQLRTPFIERVDRMRMPHIGGIVFLVENGRCQIVEKLYPLPGPKPTSI